MEDPVFDAQNNIMGTLNLLNAARKASIKRFMYFSSAATYGNPLRLPVDQSHPTEPLSPYGASKLSGEIYALMFHRAYGLPTTSIRTFNIYSPRQDPSNPYSGVISKLKDPRFKRTLWSLLRREAFHAKRTMTRSTQSLFLLELASAKELRHEVLEVKTSK